MRRTKKEMKEFMAKVVHGEVIAHDTVTQKLQQSEWAPYIRCKKHGMFYCHCQCTKCGEEFDKRDTDSVEFCPKCGERLLSFQVASYTYQEHAHKGRLGDYDPELG